jgi:hypothetical protein
MIIYEQNFFGITDANMSLNFKYLFRFYFIDTINVNPVWSRWSSNTSAIRMKSYISANTAFLFAGITGSSPIYCGWAQNSSGGDSVTQFRQNGTVHVDAYFSNGVVTIRRAGTTTLVSANIPNYAPNNWYYYELGTVIADISGSVEFRVNGQTIISASNLDTRNGVSPYVDEVGFYAGSPDPSHYITDWYITNGEGSNPATNGFLGDIRIFSTIPTASGDTINFTPLTGSNALMVDDGNSPDNDTTFVSASMPGSIDLYRTVAYTGSFTQIYGLGVKALARKTEPGSRAIQLAIKSGSTLTYFPSESILDNYRYHAGIFERNPNTGTTWSSLSDVNNTQIGFTIL